MAIQIHVSEKDKHIHNAVLCRIADEVDVLLTASDRPEPGKVNVGAADFACRHNGCAEYLANRLKPDQWQLVYPVEDGGFIITGDCGSRINSALLDVIDCLKRNDVQSLRTGFREPVFKRMDLSFDDCSFGFTRAADDFDLEEHLYEVVRLGIENFEINRLYDDIPVQIRERRIWRDRYQWWNTYMPALDMFYESELSRGTYAVSMLQQNRAVLLQTAALARSYGLKLTYTTFEPRAWPERLFHHFPELRGARVDHPAYSSEPEYAPDINHPHVLAHYRDLMRQLMHDVPDLDLFEVWAQDSAAGFPWAEKLYAGANGPIGVRREPVSASINRFLGTLKAEASKINSETKIHINISWVFPHNEQDEIIRHLPDELGISFGFARKPGVAITDDAWSLIGTDKRKQARGLMEGVGCNWKRYAPLLGFPFPGGTLDKLRSLAEAEVMHVALRGGIVPPMFVPHCINSEVIKAFQIDGAQFDLESLLIRKAEEWTNSRAEADMLVAAWHLCDAFDASYDNARQGLHWTTSMFVSPRTLFRKMVRPIVPDHSLLNFEETRYYQSNVFLTHETDPSWHDISFFNFEQMTSDENMIRAVARFNSQLLPTLNECLQILETAGSCCSDTLRDVRDRVRCFLFISQTERNLLDVQVAIHQYYITGDHQERQAISQRIKAAMLNDIETTQAFVELLRTTSSVLIPVTSGEETPFMFKAPLDQLLRRKIIVMEKHLDDLPGPHFEGCYFLERRM
jgi:hypothetical protein